MSFEIIVQHRSSERIIIVTSTTTVQRLIRLALIAFDLPRNRGFIWALFLPGSINRLNPLSIPDYSVNTVFILRHTRLPRPRPIPPVCPRPRSRGRRNNPALVETINDGGAACWGLLAAVILIGGIVLIAVH